MVGSFARLAEGFSVIRYNHKRYWYFSDRVGDLVTEYRLEKVSTDCEWSPFAMWLGLVHPNNRPKSWGKLAIPFDNDNAKLG